MRNGMREWSTGEKLAKWLWYVMRSTKRVDEYEK